MKNQIKLEGFDEAIKLLDALPDKFQRQTILAMFRRSTRPMIRSARSRLKSYGAAYNKLSKSIGNITVKSKNPIIYVGPRVKGKWSAIGYIAHWVEYGTKGVRGGGSKKTSGAKGYNSDYAKTIGPLKSGQRYRVDQPPRPFMRPAIDQHSKSVKSLVSSAFSQHLEKTINRYLKK